MSAVNLEIQEKITDYEEEYPLFFKSPKQLVDFINKLEEQNLQFIQFNQDYEMEILEQTQEVEKQNTINCAKFNALSETKRELFEQVKKIEEEIRQSEARNRAFEFSSSDQNLEQLKGSLYSIYHAFKQHFDKGLLLDSVRDLVDKNVVLNCLSQVETIIYRMGVALKKEDQKSIFKQVSS